MEGSSVYLASRYNGITCDIEVKRAHVKPQGATTPEEEERKRLLRGSSNAFPALSVFAATDGSRDKLMHPGSDGAARGSPGRQVVFTNIRNFPRICLLFHVGGGVPRRFLRAQKVVIAAEDDVGGR
ncbi:hypothetical protein EYF80_000222 [Liparis tanakae]|uniref:Uncharacterized protein n=1 Tax=Liparis tanakae TaxID=230148 RepID=A0A4Z2JH34_9TELE|nr:hypothetical protein EYF80_000222 [Liparis tanakae]